MVRSLINKVRGGVNRYKKSQEFRAKLSGRPLVISAGMPRSGSTLLFNIVRETLAQKWGEGVSAGWRDDFMALPKGNIYLLKTHYLEDVYLKFSSHRFYSYRDIRVAAVSNFRKFDASPDMQFFRRNIQEYQAAKNHCDLLIKYEELLANPVNHVQQIADILEVGVDADKIVEKTFNLEAPKKSVDGYAKDTLLHENHFTHTQDDEWRHVLSDDLKNEINEELAWWFEECGYPLA